MATLGFTIYLNHEKHQYNGFSPTYLISATQSTDFDRLERQLDEYFTNISAPTFSLVCPADGDTKYIFNSVCLSISESSSPIMITHNEVGHLFITFCTQSIFQQWIQELYEASIGKYICLPCTSNNMGYTK